MLNAHESIEAEILRLLQGAGGDVPAISPASDLVGLGLTSLMFAELLIGMEMELGVDPFQGETSIVEMRTVADLVRAYDAALAAESARV
ncbi:phosphopantetheine-binding protein [Streptomyces sp. NPDC002033]|uniref:phosphopantetheine-binding protein n=1 Tax=unclassified Streptomyces TaxID=2593676 RepID=UPI0033176192